MAKIDNKFAELCRKILNEGKEYENKNRGVKRLQIPSLTVRWGNYFLLNAITGNVRRFILVAT